MLRQILYQSRINPAGPPTDLRRLLLEAQQLNALDGITGLLYADGERFLQVLEGPGESVDATYARIERDERHHRILMERDRSIHVREFGDWSMAERVTRHERDMFDQRMRTALVEASAETQRWFDGLVRPAG